MHDNLFWQITSDGVVFAMPEGFVNHYYIYPPNYDEGFTVNKYELWVTHKESQTIYKFDTLEQAKEFVVNKVKSIIRPVILNVF